MKREKCLVSGNVDIENVITGKVVCRAHSSMVEYTTDMLYVKVGSVTRKFDRATHIIKQYYKEEKENKTMENMINTTNENVTENNEIASEEKEVLVVSRAEIPETIDETLNIIFDTEKINALATQDAKTIETVKYDNKEMAVFADIRDEFIRAYKKSLTLANNVEWAQRQVITQTMNSSVFKNSFINEGDYAEQIGVSKSYLSKAKTAVVIFDWLKDNGYGTNWKATAVEELISTWNDLAKKKISFKQFMQFSELKEGMTVSETRRCIKRYKESMTPKVVTTTSIPANTVTTTSIPANTVTTTSISANTVTATPDKDKTFQLAIKNFDIEAATINEMNISVSYGDITLDIWLNKEDNKKLIGNIERLIKGKLKVEIANLKKGGE